MLINFPFHFLVKVPVKILIKPAKQIISTPALVSSSCRASSKSSREEKFVCLSTYKSNGKFILRKLSGILTIAGNVYNNTSFYSYFLILINEDDMDRNL